MHSDTEAVKKSVRAYFVIGAALFLGTVITVAVNQVHLAIPLAVSIALIIATTKTDSFRSRVVDVGAP